MIDAPSPNHDARPGAIDAVVLHYTGMRSGPAALVRLRDPAAKVSAHYLVEEDGRVFSLVPESRRAWHAGVSCWGGQRDLNARSVGIEIVNPGHEWGYRPFPAVQMAAVIDLLGAVMGRHGIVPARVLAHSDIAPTRKEDPGELFDWRGLARAGLSVWPEATGPAPADEARFRAAAARFGYDPSVAQPALLTAFRRRFAPGHLGAPLTGHDVAMIEALAARWPVAGVPAAGVPVDGARDDS